MEQQVLFEFEPRRLARHFDPSTSHAAAERVREFSGGQCVAILQVLRQRGSLSPEQIAAHLKLDAYQIRKRLPELQRAGMAEPTGQAVPTVSGRSQRLWRAVA